jgi:hypothetical protein
MHLQIYSKSLDTACSPTMRIVIVDRAYYLLSTIVKNQHTKPPKTYKDVEITMIAGNVVWWYVVLRFSRQELFRRRYLL